MLGTSGMNNMAAIMAKVRHMSDAQLAEVLSGKNMSVPQFAAMTEAMGRKELRNAMQGAQAQQQAHQPSIKDQLMAANAQEQSQGIAGLPAPNMEAMGEGMAGGGIIAFDNGGRVPTWEDVQDAEQKWKEAQTPWYMPTPKVNPADAYAQDYQRVLNAYQNKKELAGLKDLAAAAAVPTAPTVNPTPDLGERREPAAAPKKSDVVSTAVAPAEESTKSTIAAPERRPSPYAGFKAEAPDYAKIKEQALGEGLMGLAAGILSKQGAAGYGAGMEALANKAASTRKEIADLDKSAREYNFLVAKAQDAHDQGDDELALKYKTLAEQTDYHKVMGKAATTTAQAHMLAASNKGANVAQIGLKDATAQFNKLTPQQKRGLPPTVNNARAYWDYINGKHDAFVSGKPGDDATILQ